MVVSIGIVGSGLSGLACAWRILQQAPMDRSVSVTVFEWGRGPGGRMARKRVTLLPGRQQLFFDHGAPFFALAEDVLLATGWRGAGYVTDWSMKREGYYPLHSTDLPDTDSRCPSANIIGLREQAANAEVEAQPVQVGSPESNNALCKSLAAEIESSAHEAKMLYGRHVIDASWNGQGWTLTATNRFPEAGASARESYAFDVLILSDKLAVLPNAYAVLKPGMPITQRLSKDLQFGRARNPKNNSSPSHDHGREISEPAGTGETAEAILALASSASSSASTLVLLVALVLKEAGGAATLPDIMSFPDHPMLSFAVFENRKPTRVTTNTTVGDDGLEVEVLQFVVHSTPEHAAKNMVWDVVTGEGTLSASEDSVAEEFWNAFSTAVFRGMEPSTRGDLDDRATTVAATCTGRPVVANLLHRSLFVWDHARPSATASSIWASSSSEGPFWWANTTEEGVLGVCGDFFGAGDVNSAARSGLGLADRVLKDVLDLPHASALL